MYYSVRVAMSCYNKLKWRVEERLALKSNVSAPLINLIVIITIIIIIIMIIMNLFRYIHFT